MLRGEVESTVTATSQSGPAPRGRRPLAFLAPFAISVSGVAAITAYLAFRSGGYFAGAPAIVAVVLGIALTFRLVLADAPFKGFGTTSILAVVGLGAYAAWALISTAWSDAPAQALVQFDLALMYWLGLVFFGSFGSSRERVVWALRLLAVAMFAVAVAALVTRLIPSILSAPVTLENYRLGYPLSYWNALGVFVSVAIVLCAGLATRAEEPLGVKAAAAAALPILVSALYFTFSRGAIGVLVICLALFVVLAARRELVPSLIAIVPPVAIALALSLGTDVLSTAHFTSARGVSEGHTLAWQLIACAVGAGVLRIGMFPLDRALARLEIPKQTRRRATLVGVGAIVVAIVVVGVAVDAPAKISNDFQSFADTKPPKDPEALQDRLTNLNNNGRVVQWELALKNFGGQPLEGSGAGTFARVWAQEGNGELKVVNAHSLYLEVMSNLGLPGIIFLLTALISIFVGLAMRIRGPDRVLYATIFTAAFTWALHAGLDWDWELPATGFFVFGLGGLAIAADRRGSIGWSPGRTVRVALGIGSLALVVSPALMAISQGYLDSSVRGLEKGDCGTASHDALKSIQTLSVRPEPYQVLGFCDSRAGQNALAISLLRTAISRDPGEWESYYGLALVQAAAEKDPRPAARKALSLAPYEPLTKEAVHMFRTADPKKWRRRALRARLPIL
jgi:O-antigen ligase